MPVLPSRDPVMMGRKLFAGRYRLARLLEAGPFKVAWCAWDTLLRRDVAVALYRFHPSNGHVVDPSAYRQFWRELRTLARTSDSPGIVPVFDAGEFRGQGFLVTRLMAGPGLASVLEGEPQRRLSPVRAAAIAGDILCTLDVIHSVDLAHRDLRPRNVWFDTDGRPVLANFGLASGWAPGLVGGLPHDAGVVSYLAPEQLRGEPAGSGADLYALGCMLYEMLTGRPPFTGDAADIAAQQLASPPAPPSLLVPELRSHLDQLVLQLLQKDPAARPSAAEARSLLHGGNGRRAGASEGQPAVPTLTLAPSSPGVESPGSAPPADIADLREQPRRPGISEQAAGSAPTAGVTRPRGRHRRGLALVLTAAAAAVVLLVLVRPRPASSPQSEQVAPSVAIQQRASTVAPTPSVTDLRVYDNIFDQREHEFIVDRTVTVCFTLKPDGDDPLIVVVTRSGQSPVFASEPGNVARSADIPQRAGGICAPVTFPEGQPQAGEYTAWVLRQGKVLGTASFRVLGTLTAAQASPTAPSSPTRPEQVRTPGATPQSEVATPPVPAATWVRVEGLGDRECATVYELPTVAARVVNCLPNGVTTQRFDGPRSVDGKRWWRVAAGGWASEDHLTPVNGPVPPSGLSPQETVTQYYSMLFQQRWGAAYQFLSVEYQQQQPYGAWVQSFSGTRDILVDGIGPGAAGGEVVARYRTVDQLPTGLTMRAWEETWQLLMQSGEWRLASARRQEVPLAYPTPTP